MVTRELGPLIIRKHTIELSSIPEFQKKELHYSALRIGDRVLPSFPIGTALLTLPYSAATLAVWRGEITEEFLDRCEKHVAALFGVASALLLFWGVRRRFGENVAIATFALFAFGTTAFTCVGQSLFSTTGEVFLFCLALALVLPEDASLARVIGAGLAMGGAFFCRPSALIATGCVGLALLLRRRRDGLVFGAVAGAVVAIAALWLKLVYGNPLGGYAIMNSQAGMWGQTILVGLAGNLVSPSRGVLLFFPYLLFVPLAAALVRRDPEARTWWLASLLVFTATVGLASGYNKWWGGYSVGPRLTTEAAPFLALLLIPIWQAWRRLGRVRIAIVLSVLLAMATQVLFAYNWRVHSWSAEVLEHHPDALWSLRYGQLAAAWIPAWRPIPDAVNEQFLRRGGTQHWHPLDIASVANARYDLDPFMENAPKDSWSHYPRLDSWSLNTAGQNFQFLPAGKPNAVTTCREAAPAEIPVPRLSGARIHAIVAAGATERRIDQPALAYLEVRYADESTERIPIRLDAEVFEYALERRVGTIDPAKVYAGRAAESDALVVSTFPVAKPQLPILGIRLVGEPTMAPAGVSLFAITLEE